MVKPLMPKATAVWLVENTTLTFDQISQFCGLHPLEVQGIADGEVATGIIGQDPIRSGQVTQEELERCQQDSQAELKLNDAALQHLAIVKKKKKKSKYTPVARRQDKPDAIAWLLKHCPYINDTQITKLIGTTKNTIKAIRERSHWNIGNISSRDPVLLGLCTQTELDKVIAKAKAQAPEAEKVEAQPDIAPEAVAADSVLAAFNYKAEDTNSPE